MDDATRSFESARRLLEGIAYRMLGTLADAQDVVQETYLRWMAANHDDLRDPRAWLVTVCTRLATNSLRSARVRRETYVGTWLPEPLVAPDPVPEERHEIDESVSVALLVALETLSPLERAAFLLHDVFDLEFEEISAILERTPPACRKLASRARVSVRARRPRFSPDLRSHRAVVTSFADALRTGDVAGIARLLADDATMRADGGGKVSATAPLDGAPAIVALFSGIFAMFDHEGTTFDIELRWFNGALGILTRENGKLATSLSLDVDDGRIRAILAQRNPEKLAAFGPLHG